MMPGENSPLSEEYFDIVSVTRNRFIGTATVTVRGKNGEFSDLYNSRSDRQL